MAGIVGIVSRHSLRIEMHHKNEPTQTKLVLCKVLLLLQKSFKMHSCMYVTRQSALVIKVGVAYDTDQIQSYIYMRA